jgi:electron transfer flavoprotein beta subunit
MPYDIIVLIKQIPDLELVKVDQTTGEPITEGVPFKLENLSKNSVEAAVRIKEKNGGKVSAILFGNERGTQVMKEAYAMGVDDGYLITGYTGNNPTLTAKVLAQKIKQLHYDLVVLGNQSADSMSGLLPGLVATELNVPLLPNVISIDTAEKIVKASTATEKEVIKLETSMPVVISVTQETNEPRFPPVLQIIKAGKKAINTEQSSIKLDSTFRTISRKAPKSDRKRLTFEDVDKGAQEVAKVLKEAM